MTEVIAKRSIQKSTLKSIPIEKLKRGQYQPRTAFSADSLSALADTIKIHGILEPILVRPLSNLENFEIIAGERRWRAAQIARLEEVPCLVGLYSDKDAAQIALIENISREDLNPIEEARAIKKNIDQFSYTYEEMCAILGKKNRSEISNKLRLLELDVRVQTMLISGDLVEGHGKVLAGVEQKNQYFLAKQALESHWSVRKLEEMIKRYYSDSKKNKKCSAITRKKDPNIAYLERRVTDMFGHPMELEVKEGSKTGFVKIPFRDFDHLNLILFRMGYKEK